MAREGRGIVWKMKMRQMLTLTLRMSVIYLSERRDAMKKNVGTADRFVRVLLAVIVGILYFTGNITGTAAIVLGIIAISLLLTSSASLCPLYSVLGISTVKKK
jgi:hypothetical protein